MVTDPDIPDPVATFFRHAGIDPNTGPPYTHTIGDHQPGEPAITIHTWTLDIDANTGDTTATIDVTAQPDDLQHALEQLAADGIRVTAYTRHDPDGTTEHHDRTALLNQQDDVDHGNIPCPTCGHYRSRYIGGGRLLTDGSTSTPEPCAACTTWRDAGTTR